MEPSLSKRLVPPMQRGTNRRKKAITIIVLAALYTGHANATGWPTLDIAGLMQKITSSMEEGAQWIKTQAENEYQRTLDSLHLQTEMATDQKVQQAAINSQGEAAETMHNIQMAKEAAPDRDICINLATSLGSSADSTAPSDPNTTSSEQNDPIKERLAEIQDALCSEKIEDAQEELADKFDFNQFTVSVRDQEQNNKDRAVEIIDECTTTQLNDEKINAIPTSDDGKQLALASSKCGNIVPQDGSLSATASDAVAAKNTIKILAGTPSIKRLQDFKGAAGKTRKLLMQYMKENAFRNIGVMSLTGIADTYTAKVEGNNGVGGVPSKLGEMQSYTDSKFGSAEWKKCVANVCDSDGNVVPIQSSDDLEGKDPRDYAVESAELLRKLTALQAFSIDMQVEQYKQTLRHESVSAALLLLEAN